MDNGNKTDKDRLGQNMAYKSMKVKRYVKRDPRTGQYIEVRADKNATVLAATVGGAILGNMLVPGIGGALFGGIAGAILGNTSKKDYEDE